MKMISNCAHISCHYGCYVPLSPGLKCSTYIHISFGSSEFFSDSLRYFLKFTFFAIGIEIAIDFIPKIFDWSAATKHINMFIWIQTKTKCMLPPPCTPFHIGCLFVSYFHFGCSIDRYCSGEQEIKQENSREYPRFAHWNLT